MWRSFSDIPIFPIFQDGGRTTRSWSFDPISGTICCPWSKYDCCTNKARHWYDLSVWPVLCTLSATICTTTGTIDTTKLAISTIALTLSPTCYHGSNDPVDHSTIVARFWQPSRDRCTLHTTASTLWYERPTSRPSARSGWSPPSAWVEEGIVMNRLLLLLRWIEPNSFSSTASISAQPRWHY